MYELQVRETGEHIPVGKMLCLGKNYERHAREMGGEVPTDPVVFMKPRTALIGNGGSVVIPSISDNVHHELELVVIMGSTAKNVQEHEVMEHVLGYAIGLDMTLRDIQARAKERGEPWAVAKGFDTSGPISDVVLKEHINDPHDLMLSLTVNSDERQRGSTGEMALKIPAIISYLSRIYTLERGDCIFTGTPEGVARVVSGDRLHAEIEGVVALDVKVE